MTSEKRYFARHDSHAKASIHYDYGIIDGDVENLSMQGVLIRATRRIELDQTVDVTIYYPLSPIVLCSQKAKVVRVTENAMGLQFEKSLLA